MPSKHGDETLLVQYLLGSLSEQTQAQVEDRAFAEDEFRQALEAAEADLIDAYVRGQLSPAYRQAFERRFLTSPGRRSKVEFARALAVVASGEASESAVSKSRPMWQSLISLIRGCAPNLRFAMALAALICVAGVSWLIVRNSTMRAQIAALETQPRDLERQRQELRQGLTEQPKGTPREAPVPVTAVASLVLFAGLSRTETAPAQLVLAPGLQLAHIQIRLEPRDAYPRFRAELRTRGGEEVLTRDNLRRSRAGAGYVVSFDVPASALNAGQYELALLGVPAGASAEEVSYSYFTVRFSAAGR